VRRRSAQIARSGGVGKRLTCETMEADGEAAKPVKSCSKGIGRRVVEGYVIGRSLPALDLWEWDAE